MPERDGNVLGGASRSSRRPAVVEALIEAGARCHVLEPGGLVFIGGLDIESPEVHEELSRALRGAAPDVMWIATAAAVELETMTAGMRSALVAQASGLLDDSSELMTVTDVPDQRIRILCPRCDDHVPMSIVAVATDGPAGLSVRTMADPDDVDLHNLSCTGLAAR